MSDRYYAEDEHFESVDDGNDDRNNSKSETVSDIGEWEELKEDSDYEINVIYPHQIRKKSTKRILKETATSKGYLTVNIDKKNYRKHRFIALQWIPNPDNLPCIDHINHIRTDNRISNLRWVSYLQNANNNSKSSTGREIEYVQQFPENAVVVDRYSRFEFDGVYFYGEKFYVDTGNGDYRIIPICMNQGYKKVGLKDKYGIRRLLSYDKFLKEYGLD